MTRLTPLFHQWLTTYTKAPEKVRLEWADRLDNLCEYSGMPMTPELRLYVTRNFGLEMVRIIEGFSTYSVPRLDPDLVIPRINKMIPRWFYWEFIRLFDRVCAIARCMYTGSATAGVTTDIGIWDIDAADFIVAPDFPWVVAAALQALYPAVESGFISVGGTSNLLWMKTDTPPNWAVWENDNITPIVWDEGDCVNTEPTLCYATSYTSPFDINNVVVTEIEVSGGLIYQVAALPLNNQTVIDMIQGWIGQQGVVDITIGEFDVLYQTNSVFLNFRILRITLFDPGDSSTNVLSFTPC